MGVGHLIQVSYHLDKGSWPHDTDALSSNYIHEGWSLDTDALSCSHIHGYWPLDHFQLDLLLCVTFRYRQIISGWTLLCFLFIFSACLSLDMFAKHMPNQHEVRPCISTVVAACL